MLWKLLLLALFLSLAAPAAVGAEGETDAAAREKAVETFIRGDYETALAALEPMARAGDPVAQFIMGYAHEEGLGREQDLDTAVRWYERAAEGGHLEAMVRMGEMYAAGYGVAAQDDVRAIEYVTRAAGYGYPLAQHFLGMYHLWGVLGLERNARTARSYFELAAAQGFGPSISVKGALDLTEAQRAALISQMTDVREHYAAGQVLDFDSQQECMDELKSWSFQAASLYFALIVVEDEPDRFFAALLGTGEPFSPVGESYWECRDGRLRLWH